MPSREKLLNDLAPALMEGEEVLDLTTGMVPVRRLGSKTERSGTIAVTNRRIILLTTKIGGYDSQDFAFGLLSSVDYKKGIVFANLDLAAAGDRTRVKMIPTAEIERIAQLIRAKMAEARAPASAPSQDVPGQIRELGKLRDEGLISPDEFEAKKRQLLGL